MGLVSACTTRGWYVFCNAERVDFDEREDVSPCIDCGAPLLGEGERSFATAPGAFLCFACAERRGGVYDEAHDRWASPPDVSGVPDERRPHP